MPFSEIKSDPTGSPGEINLGFIQEEDEVSSSSIGQENKIKSLATRRRSSVNVTTRTLLRRVSKVFSTGMLLGSEVKLVGMSEEEFLTHFFDASDYYRTGKLTQDKWIDLLKSRLTWYLSPYQYSHHDERKIDFVEIVESVSYVVAGNEDLTFDLFRRVFRTKNVLTKFLRILDHDLDGIVSRDQAMEFICQLNAARSGSRLTRDNIAYLERLFRQYVGNDKEIKKSDFSKIIQTKNQFFTDRVFDLFDVDSNGSISLQEFLDAMHRFTGENPEDKIRFLFKVYDVDGDGEIQEEELEKVMRACMEENGMKFSDDQIHELTTALFEDADTEGRGALSYDSLKAQLQKHGGLLENLSISIERWLVPVKPIVIRRRAPVMTKIRSWIPHQLSSRYLKNNYAFVLWLISFLVMNFALFVSRAVIFDKYHPCSTVWLMIAKSTGQSLNFNCTYILFMMLKQSLTFLRSRGASTYLPIDHHLYFHKLAGYFIVSLEFGLIPNPSKTPRCVNKTEETWTFVQYLFVPKASPGFGLIAGYAFNTGVVIVVVLLVMFICSLPFVRRSGYFEIFYWTHPLYTIFWLLLIIHTRHFWIWFLIPGIIFVIEQAVRFYRWRIGSGKTYVSSGILLPSKVTHLIIRRPPNFHFHPGDYVFIRIPAIAQFEWHPFTISSSPEQEDAIWLHIRAVGEWTNRLYEYFEHEQSSLNPAIWDFRPKTNAFTKGINFRKTRDSLRTYSSNRLTVDGPTRLQLKSVADSVSSCAPQSTRASSTNISRDNGTFTSSEDVLNENEIGPRKVPLSKMNSMPNMSQETDNIAQPIVQNPLTGMVPKGNPNSRRSSDSVNQIRRYLRYKPPILTFQTPLDSKEGMKLISDAEEGSKGQKVTPDKTWYELGTTRVSQELPVGKCLEIFIDGPLGAPSSHIFRAEHAVLIATGIGVTPFASILQSIMRRYWASRNICPNCNFTWCSALPESVLKLKKVDFFWINRDQRSFEWFVHLLSQLEIEQAELGGAMERFLDMHMYITSALQKTDMKAVGLQLALDLLHEKEKRDLITGLKTRTNAGRPNWTKIFSQIQDQHKGKVTVFYCGPPALARAIKLKCDEYGFAFRKEIF